MQIVVRRSGGFAGLPRAWRVDTDARPDADRWTELVGALPGEGSVAPGAAPEGAGGEDADRDDSAVRDDYVWTVTVARTTVTIPGRRLDGPWAALVEQVRDQGEPA
ncbi:hypothetical protein DEJ16_00405 [Curtobacterium sp. MCJR17_055]|uniref:protealysin inhibitor emfourin n=1 Tax=unclassified Curtobacterium TaxID=257496 RepID=UPI000D896A84|nr:MULTISPECIES: protealysin inhibitor emfourin [unclassified Curtobacterium]PYY34617.1 hypothetical protein DEI87_09490 [Curtobacterium sp. MCBD17_029]PYY57566.1 hypothetical protein DEJ26_11600 [Curtobacterium sp. MCPF17_015]PYY58222.1 hypothetical protein DEJ16_00405 [Curtobacterium sp. MCJR17_055]WIB36883.1 hypothetical protein DEJ15_07840 [Curtobacterium sp. MCJR17_043]